jgi:hypothetical protein
VMMRLEADYIDIRQRSGGRCRLGPSQPARGSARQPCGAEGRGGSKRGGNVALRSAYRPAVHAARRICKPLHPALKLV